MPFWFWDAKSKEAAEKKKRRISSTDSSSNSDESAVFCFVCIEGFKNSRPKEFWIQYMTHQFRAHEACTAPERNGFYTCKTALPMTKYRRCKLAYVSSDPPVGHRCWRFRCIFSTRLAVISKTCDFGVGTHLRLKFECLMRGSQLLCWDECMFSFDLQRVTD